MPPGHKGQRGAVSDPAQASAAAHRQGAGRQARHLAQRRAASPQGARGRGAGPIPARASGRGCAGLRLPPEPRPVKRSFPRRYERDPDRAARSVVEREGREAAVGHARGVLRRSSPAGSRRSWWAPAGRAAGRRGPAPLRRGLHGRSAGRARRRRPDRAVLTEHNCAIQAVAERFPEICAAEARFLADVLGAEVERHRAHLERLPACEYQGAVQPSRRGEVMSSSSRNPGQQGVQVRLRHRHRSPTSRRG